MKIGKTQMRISPGALEGVIILLSSERAHRKPPLVREAMAELSLTRDHVHSRFLAMTREGYAEAWEVDDFPTQGQKPRRYNLSPAGYRLADYLFGDSRESLEAAQ